MEESALAFEHAAQFLIESEAVEFPSELFGGWVVEDNGELVGGKSGEEFDRISDQLIDFWVCKQFL